MGLDSVELVVEIEKEFQIEITNLEAEKIYTVGQLYEIILTKNKLKSDKSCLSSKLFYRTRKILAKNSDFPIRQIHPDTKLKELIGEEVREDWNRLSEELDLKLPRLLRPKIMIQTIDYLGIIILLINIGIVVIDPISLRILLLLIIPIYWNTSYWLTERFAKELQVHDMRSLITGMVAVNHKFLLTNQLDSEETYHKLRGILNDKFGVPFPEISYNAEIARDLGIE